MRRSQDLPLGARFLKAAVATETECLVGSALATLPEQQRAVLVLRNWSKLSYKEIAEILGKAEGTIRSQMHHALASMRSYLESRMR